MRNKTEAYINQYKALINTETLQEGSTLYVIGQETATVRRSYLQNNHIYTAKILVQKNREKTASQNILEH